MPSGGGASIRCGFRPAWDNKKRGTTCAYGVVCEWFGLRTLARSKPSYRDELAWKDYESKYFPTNASEWIAGYERRRVSGLAFVCLLLKLVLFLVLAGSGSCWFWFFPYCIVNRSTLISRLSYRVEMAIDIYNDASLSPFATSTSSRNLPASEGILVFIRCASTSFRSQTDHFPFFLQVSVRS